MAKKFRYVIEAEVHDLEILTAYAKELYIRDGGNGREYIEIAEQEGAEVAALTTIFEQETIPGCTLKNTFVETQDVVDDQA